MSADEAITLHFKQVENSINVLGSLGFEVMMIAVKDQETPHLLGTNKGLQYIGQPQVLEPFRKAVFGNTVYIKQPSKKGKSDLRTEVRQVLNSCWEKATGESKPIPYSSLLKGKVPWKLEGLPVPVKEPSNYGIGDLKKIMDNKTDIKFVKTQVTQGQPESAEEIVDSIIFNQLALDLCDDDGSVSSKEDQAAQQSSDSKQAILVNAVSYNRVSKVVSGSVISIFSLWNSTGAHCNKPGVFYRNNYIDIMTTDCVDRIYLDFGHWFNYINYYGPFSDLYLGNILSEVPNYMSKFGTPSSNDHYLISTDSYEYLWINNKRTKMHAGLYYNETDPYSPIFVFSTGGVDYALFMSNYVGVDTPDCVAGKNSSQLLSDRPVKYLSVFVYIKDSCGNWFRQPVDDSLYLGPDVKITGINGNTTEVAKGTQANLTCTISSQLPILGVNWTRDGDVLLVEQNPTKYQGMINGTHTLLINNFQLNDSGVYECTAMTAMGTGTSLPTDVQMIEVLQCSGEAERVLQNGLPLTTRFEEHRNCHSLQLLNTLTTASAIECGIQCLKTNDCTRFRVVKNKGECELISCEAGNTAFPSVFMMRN